MAKPILYYVLVRKWEYATGRAWRVLGVTSEKGRQVYGRWPDDDAATHVGQLDVIHRFPEGTTLEFASAAGERATREERRHAAAIEEARNRVKNLERHRDMCVLDAAKGDGLNPAART